MELVDQRILPRRDLALSGEVLRHLWQQALDTLQSLQSPLGVTASGPEDHFHAIFGRDSLWTVILALEAGRLLETKGQEEGSQDDRQRLKDDRKGHPYMSASHYLDWLHDLSATVLRGLARLQGKTVNDFNEEQPGRILHEYWDPIPERMIAARWPVMINGCYYGSFDATFLFIIAIAQVVAYFDDNALLEELWPNVEAAFQWMLAWSDLDSDGLVEYKLRNPDGIGLHNQVWKDSGESIRVPHGPIQHPVAWVEVQGYAHAAYASYLELAQRRHDLDPSLHRDISQRMNALSQGLQRFWLPNEHCPALALDGNKQPVPVIATNAGHLLWSTCLELPQAQQIANRLQQPDILTPWGLRTLSEKAYYYNPLVYHCGGIWPFDNAVVALGLQKYGFASQAQHVAETVLQAILAFDKPVELYTVQPSRWIRSHRLEQDWFLADYFYACSVQTWTVAAILYFTALLM